MSIKLELHLASLKQQTAPAKNKDTLFGGGGNDLLDDEAGTDHLKLDEAATWHISRSAEHKAKKQNSAFLWQTDPAVNDIEWRNAA